MRRKAPEATVQFERYLDQLKGTPGPRGTLAFFDLDRTLIAGYSITALALERVRSGSVSLRRILYHAGTFIGYGLGRAGYHDLLQATVDDLVGLPEQELIELGEAAYRKRLQGLIYQEARTLVDVHRALGHELVMVTSATRYQAVPVARDLGVEHLFCTELDISNGVITGQVHPCFGPGKRNAAERLGRQRNADLGDAFFYTDSGDDLPLLEAVGRPVAANAKTSLSRVAAARGWPQLVFAAVGEQKAPIAA